MRNFQTPNRSALHAANAAVATSHPAASLAAIEILRAGGNAVDASVCAAAVLCVVEPVMTGLGGDAFAIVAQPGKALYGMNASGPAPSGISTEDLLAQGIAQIDPLSGHSVTVPGLLRGWEHLMSQFGTMDFAQVLRPAIDYAENGFVVQPRVGSDWSMFEQKLKKQSKGGSHYLTDGHAPAVGIIQRHPALAQTLRTISKNGADAFYSGPIADEIIALVRQNGGVMSAQDMRDMAVLPLEPLMSDYRDMQVAELPPNGTGVIAQLILKMLEPFDLGSLDPTGADRYHLETEAARIAYAVRDAEIADARYMRLDTAELLQKSHVRGLHTQIDPRTRRTDITDLRLPVQSDTTYLCCVDRDGMAVSLINSLYMGFGSGFVTEKSGITLQNRGANFTVAKDHPNTIEGGKRPMHTIIPAMALTGGEVSHCFGVMGGMYQPLGHAHVMINTVDFGMDPQEALETPRVFWDETGALTLEEGVSDQVASALVAKGHAVSRATIPHGGGQIIQIDHKTGTLIAGSDPRKDGCALGY